MESLGQVEAIAKLAIQAGMGGLLGLMLWMSWRRDMESDRRESELHEKLLELHVKLLDFLTRLSPGSDRPNGKDRGD